MAEFWLRREGAGWVPVDELTTKRTNRFKAGDVVRAEIIKPRNPAFHRKFMSLMNLVLENTERFSSTDELLNWIKVKVGHYEVWAVDGRPMVRPKSISFASMDDNEFSEFYDKARQVVIDHFMPDYSPDQVSTLAETYLSY